MASIAALFREISELATSVGNALQLRGFKPGGTAGQVPVKGAGGDYDWTWGPVGAGSVAWGDVTGKPATFPPTTHASSHTNGTDDIQNATAAQKGLATAAQITKLDGIEAGADVTDTANVTAAGALMDSEVTNLAQVKAFSSADYATAAQGTDERAPTSAGLTSKFGTNKATIVDADKVAILDSAASDVPKHGLLSAVWTYIKAKIEATALTFTAHLTATDQGTGTGDNSLMTRSLGDARYPRLYAYARATSATIDTANTVVKDITGLSLTISETGIYRLSSFVSVTPANSAMGIKVGPIYSANTGTLSGIQMFTNNSTLSAASPSANSVLNTSNNTRQVVGGVNSQPAQLREEHVLNITGVPVTVKYQFAQHTSNASNLTADIGNWMILEKLA